MPSPREIVAGRLAAALQAGEWGPEAVLRRAVLAWGEPARWLETLVDRIFRATGARPPSAAELAEFLDRDRRFQERWGRWPGVATPKALGWPLPRIRSLGGLAEWLGLTHSELDWFSRRRTTETRSPAGPLRHYVYAWIAKLSGRRRLLEKPKQRLKQLQRRILHDILDGTPPHDAVHGFRAGRSAATHAALHCGRRLLLRVDLQDFFPSVGVSWVAAVFRSLGYPSSVARALAGICTNAAPADVFAAVDRGQRRRYEAVYGRPHLPQGAPTSPALANLCAYQLDSRLAGLAEAAGAVYSRYADDLAFSGDEQFAKRARPVYDSICRVVLEEGFEVQAKKTRWQRPAQRQAVAGVTVNVRLNVERADYDRLKATLHNCVRAGLASQNRDGHPDFRAHLLGRIGYVRMLHPERGERLLRTFEKIVW